MKKVLMAFGIIFVMLVIVVTALICYGAVTGSRLDKESKAYVDAAVPAIVSSWNEQALLRRASPEFQKAGKMVSVRYLAKAGFERGEATIEINLVGGRLSAGIMATRSGSLLLINNL